MKIPAVKLGVERSGYEPTDMSSAEFATFLRAEADRYALAVKAAKIEPQ